MGMVIRLVGVDAAARRPAHEAATIRDDPELRLAHAMTGITAWAMGNYLGAVAIRMQV